MTRDWMAISAALAALGGPAAAQTFTSTKPTMTATTPTYKLYGSDSRFDYVEGDITVTPTLPTLSTGIKLESGVLTITGSSLDDGASVIPSGTDVIATRGRFRATYAASAVTKIVFYGNGGDDTFYTTTNIPTEAYGGDGNDSLSGGGGDDFLVGGLGNDSLDGNGGNDVLWGSGGHDDIDGGSGDDHIKGHGGNDFLFGGWGNDAIFGGTGDDEISGSYGVDTLVSIGGGNDDVVGGPGIDYFWVDTTDDVIDASLTESNEGYVNEVASFYSYRFPNGTTVAVGKDLTNFDLADPIPHHGTDTLVDHAHRPLFSSMGPTAEDVIQGGADDCFILGPLAAVARQTPDSIRKMVVDLDDTTYVVRFFREGVPAPQYVRVDGDLYERARGDLRYAELGVENSVWVPIVEKAFAFFRNNAGTYASIDGGNNGNGGRGIMGADTESFEIPTLFGANDVIAWIAAGRPSGGVRNYINGTVPMLLDWINDRLDEGRPVYTGYWPGATDTTTLDTNNWRRGKHIIMIDRVLFDANGNPNGLAIRDQIGPTIHEYRDFAHIYHLFGRARTYDMP